jgi:hypothetical protein
VLEGAVTFSQRHHNGIGGWRSGPEGLLFIDDVG